VTQLQIWQDHRFFIVQQSELWVWVSEKFQFSIFLPCKRSRNFAEKISGLYSVLSRVFTDKKFFWERYRAAKHFFGWHVCLSSILVAQSEKRWTFRQCQGQTLEDLQVSLWAIFLRMTFRGIVENASSHFHFPFSSAAAKIALHFFFVEFFEMIETKNFTVEFVQEKFIWKTPFMTYPEFDLHHTAVLKY
jgi:hypothetical protein